MLYRAHVSFHKDFIKIEGNEIEIGVLAKPVNGKANAEIIKKVAKHFGISKSKVTIIAGSKSQNKVIQVAN